MKKLPEKFNIICPLIVVLLTNYITCYATPARISNSIKFQACKIDLGKSNILKGNMRVGLPKIFDKFRLYDKNKNLIQEGQISFLDKTGTNRRVIIKINKNLEPGTYKLHIPMEDKWNPCTVHTIQIINKKFGRGKQNYFIKPSKNKDQANSIFSSDEKTSEKFNKDYGLPTKPKQYKYDIILSKIKPDHDVFENNQKGIRFNFSVTSNCPYRVNLTVCGLINLRKTGKSVPTKMKQFILANGNTGIRRNFSLSPKRKTKNFSFFFPHDAFYIPKGHHPMEFKAEIYEHDKLICNDSFYIDYNGGLYELTPKNNQH